MHLFENFSIHLSRMSFKFGQADTVNVHYFKRFNEFGYY